MKRPCIAIVGRANVGKSSLFNRILGHRAAVVHDRPGVTRDRHFQEWMFNGRRIDVVDTGGFIDEKLDPLAAEVRRQIELAVVGADVVLFMIDARTGVTYDDIQMARYVLRSGRKTLLLANKSERPQDREPAHEWLSMGLGPAHCVSATTGYGFDGLMERLVKILPPPMPEPPEERSTVRVAILGRPNAGKSTLVNHLLGEERMIISPIPGTTRDSVDTSFTWKGRKVVITDTAGLRKKAKVKDSVEYFSNMRALESVRRSHVALFLVDAATGLEEQDLRILRQIEEAGKGLVIGFSKWDAREKDHRTFDVMVKDFRQKYHTIAHVPMIAFSSQESLRVGKLLDKVLEVRESNRRIVGRERIIEWFRQCVEHRQPPAASGQSVKLLRCCQVHVDPPMFAIETETPLLLSESYRRYLRNSAHDFFNLEGVPLRIAFRDELELRTDEDLIRHGGVMDPIALAWIEKARKALEAGENQD